MSSPEEGEDLFVYLGASETAVSSVLLRQAGSTQLPIYYVSKSLTGAEVNYTKMEKLVYALILSARKLKAYFQSHAIIVVTDKPLKQIIQKPDISGRLIKWSIELSGFDIRFIPRTAIKAQVLADFIADLSPPEASTSDAMGEVPPPWELFTDGASSTLISGAGIVLKSPEDLVLFGSIEFQFKPTNNQAEYEAILAGLKLALALGVQHLTSFTDSLLVANQVLKIYQCKDPLLLQYLSLVRDEIAKFQSFTIKHVTREQNQLADLLSKNSGPSATIIQKLEFPSITVSEIKVCNVQLESPDSWMTPLMKYLQGGGLPPSRSQARAIKSKAARYFIWEGFLYKKSFSGISLKCVHPLQVPDVLQEVHEGECGSHSAGRTFVQKILRLGYYWPTLAKDAIDFAKRCKACQVYGNVLHQPPQPLKPIISPWPFSSWEWIL